MDFGYGHPLRGDRFDRFMTLARSTGFLENIEIAEPVSASEEDLLLTHTQSYLNMVEAFAMESIPLTPDTPLVPELPKAARMLVGGTLLAGKKALDHGLCMGFGGTHHASRDRGGGFCLYNDVAVLSEWLKHKGYKRILNLDTDAHCGDGTLDTFYKDPEVLYVSIHQHPATLYPGRGFLEDVGAGEGEGYSINLPLVPKSGIEDYRLVVDNIVLPIIKEYKPDIVIRNGGSDPCRWDHLAMLDLDLDGLTYLGSIGRDIAQENSAPLVDLSLSGYGGGIAEGWLALWRGTTGLDIDIPSPGISKPVGKEPKKDNIDMLEQAKRHFGYYWKL